MKRPLCWCCVGILAVQLMSALLPQAALWVPAAFFAVPGAVLLLRRQRAQGLCLLLGAVLVVGLYARTQVFLRLPAQELTGRTAWVTARVLETEPSYADGMVRAQLETQTVGGNAGQVRFLCASLPDCEAGDVVRGVFSFAALPADRWRLARYADGVFVSAGYETGFARVAAVRDLHWYCARAQQALSANVRYWLSPETGGVLAAMATGDRRFLTDPVQADYRAAGISHVLVVSGLHLSLLCGLVPLVRGRRKSRWLRAAAAAAVAAALMGVTGGSPSVLRAGIAVLIGSAGLLTGDEADPLTSLALSGAVLSLPNAYAVCDLSFQLSFSATAGVLFAGEGLRRLRGRKTGEAGAAEKCGHPAPGGSDAAFARGAVYCAGERAEGLSAGGQRPAAFAALGAQMRALGRRAAETLVLTCAAAAATLPVLVLAGMNVSLVSPLTNLAATLLIAPMLWCALAAAVLGFFPLLRPFWRMAALLGGVLARALNALAAACGRLPGARIHPETGYPAAVFAVLAAFCLLALLLKISPAKTAGAAALLCCFALALGVGLSRGLVKFALVGNVRSPVVVITQEQRAAVLFRGGAANANAVREYLADEGIGAVELLIDLRMEPTGACPLAAAKVLRASECAQQTPYTVSFAGMRIDLWRQGDGCYLMANGGAFCVGAVAGSPDPVTLEPPDVLLASAAEPAGFSGADAVLTLSAKYRWLYSCGAKQVYYGQTGAALWLRPGGKWQRWPARITGATNDSAG